MRRPALVCAVFLASAAAARAAGPRDPWAYPWEGGQVIISTAGCSGELCVSFCKSTQAYTACSAQGFAERRRIASLVFAEEDDYRECLAKQLGRETYEKVRTARLLDLESTRGAFAECATGKPGRAPGRETWYVRNHRLAEALDKLNRTAKRCVLDRLGRAEFDSVMDRRPKDFKAASAAMEHCAAGAPAEPKRADESRPPSQGPWPGAPGGCRDTPSCEAHCTAPANFDACLAWPSLPPHYRAKIIELKRQTGGGD